MTRRLAVCWLPLAVGCFMAACGKLPPLFATPTPTSTVTPRPTLTLTPTATATPTPIPPVKIEAADAALFEGDWPLAIADYQKVLEQNPAPAVAAAARLGVGRARLYSGDAVGALADFNALLQAQPRSPLAANAHFLSGEAQALAGQWAEAIDAYRRYQQLRPTTLDSYVEERIANAANASGDYATAAAALKAAIAAPRVGDSFDLQEQLAQTYVALGDYETALAQYDAIYDATDANWRKARMDALAGQLLQQLGRADEAHTKFLDAVNRFPDAGDSFTALVALVNDEVPVDDLQRGLVNYYAENYEPAVAALKRYVDSNVATDAFALYYLGRTYAALGDDASALATFHDLVDNYPADAWWAKAYFQIAFIQPYPQDTQTFEAFVAAAPQSPEAPDALYRAARLCERNEDFTRAAELWTRIAVEYSASAQAADAAMQAGLVLYRAHDVKTAAQRFALAVTLGDDPAQHARAWLWVGKTALTSAEARAALATAARLDPHGYYSLRAQALLQHNTTPFNPPARYSFAFDVEAEKADAEQWLRDTFPAAQSVTDVSALQPGVWREARFVRGAELWQLGLLREAHAEFDSLRSDLSADPLAMWQLALYFNQMGAHDLAIRSARAVLDDAGQADTLAATTPRLILRLRYPAPFAERVAAASAAYDVHPFLMLSKMRLESFFWKYAFSSAAARGLNQIIPATADDIAARLGLTDFTYDDLYRPAVSIPMGAFYLHEVGTATNADPAAMLAGYYAGPGNAQIWQDLAQGDPDLFVEVIRLPDAKGYVQTAYEYFAVYAEVYGK